MIDVERVGFINKVIFIAKDDIIVWPSVPDLPVFITPDESVTRCFAEHVFIDEVKNKVVIIGLEEAAVRSTLEDVHELIIACDQIKRNGRSFAEYMQEQLIASIELLNDRIYDFTAELIQEPINYPKQIKLKPVHYKAPVIKPKFIRKGCRNK